MSAKPFPAGTRGASVAILLATRNGAAYLPAQLGSIVQQEDVAWSLHWRDDGSTDGTASILQAWGDGIGNRVRRAAGSLPVRIGAGESFLALLVAAGDGDAYYAFCDQDDIWLPRKLARATARLAAVPPGVPALYCARQQLVGADLTRRELSSLPARPLGLRNALVQNVATGCTVVLNRAARALILEAAHMPADSFHDWWSYILVSSAGGTVLFDAEASILYRQHARNLVGAEANLLTRARRALRRGPRPFLSVFQGHLRALAASRPLLSDEGNRIVDAALEIGSATGPAGRLLALRRAGLYRQRLAEDIVLRCWMAAWQPAHVQPAHAAPRVEGLDLIPTRVSVNPSLNPSCSRMRA